MRDGSLVTLMMTSLAIMGTPGPATISLTAAAVAFGIRRSLCYLAGIIVGTSAVLVAVTTGITTVILSLPAVRPVLVGLSAGYILWLAYHLATSPPLAAKSGDANAPSLLGGAFLGVSNPKAWVAIAAVFTTARVTRGAALDAAAEAAALAVMIVLINSLWLLAGASLAPLLRHPRRSRIVNGGLAAVLVAATAFAILH
jgi:threonine/homoserine/homoserine lactone efflux protein